jgi:putative membrane protein
VPAIKFLTGLLTVMACSGCALAEPADRAQDFLDQAAQHGITEVAAGKLAMIKATDPEVRDFAQASVKERRQTHRLLKELAVSQDVVLPTAPSPEQRETLRDLQQKNGADFEQAYVAAQITAYQRSLALLRAEIALDRNIETKAFAKEMLPTVETRLRQAYRLARKDQRSAWLRH